jgi:peptidoglycan-N-acetylglucosamine deacetylase
MPRSVSVRQAAKGLSDLLLPASVLMVRGATRRRRIALTFDDGPSPFTRGLLDVLGAFGAKASFFVVGAACADRPSDLERIAEAGHEIGGHGYTHRLFTRLAQGELEIELRRTAALLPDGARRLVRPPRGDLSARALYACAKNGFSVVLWSRDSLDWRLRSPDAIATGFLQEPVLPGEIVLLHDGQQRTLEALPRLLEHLKETGHELVTVSDLFYGS